MIGNLPEDNEELTATSLTFTLKMILSYKNMLLNINSFTVNIFWETINKKAFGYPESFWFHMELMAGFEPAACALRVRCSTTEPHQPAFLFYNV